MTRSPEPLTDPTLALIRKRAERSVTWEPGSVPRNVSEAVADAFHDRRYLLDLLDAARETGDDMTTAYMVGFEKGKDAARSEVEPDHPDGSQHEWWDADDDETAWHCRVCGLTEYPGDPGIGATPSSTLSPEPLDETTTVIFDLAREALDRRDLWAANGYVMTPMPHEAEVRAALTRKETPDG